MGVCSTMTHIHCRARPFLCICLPATRVAELMLLTIETRAKCLRIGWQARGNTWGVRITSCPFTRVKKSAQAQV